MEGRIIEKRAAECNDTDYAVLCFSGFMSPYETCIVCYLYEFCYLGLIYFPIPVIILTSGTCPARVFP